MGFAHLHLHTQYSVLDGAIKIAPLVARAKELNISALAITDHGNMHGALEFYKEAKDNGIKPIIGCEIYICAGSRFDKRTPQQGGSRNHHLTLLSKNLTGYRNLCKLVTLGYTEGFYFKPRIDQELLKQYGEGLICLSGCVSGQLGGFSKIGNIEKARELVKYYLDVFGENFFLEIQPHKFEEQDALNKLSFELSSEFNVPLVATNDCHYLMPTDAYAQEVLTCISTGKLITDEDRLKHGQNKLHVKSVEEMYADFPEFREAVERTDKIAKMCDLEFDFSNYHMPKYEPPEQYSVEEYFSLQARDGFHTRVKQIEERTEKLTPEQYKVYEDRLEEEILLINKMGFAGYFLVVSDFIRWAKEHDIPVGPGRGSAAGSLVAYTMLITEVDPIEHKLLFERFLNPERVSMPDIDVDFCIFGRAKVIDYVVEKYGKDRVSQILTFGTLKAKAAIKDVGRALGLSFAETNRIAKLVPAPRQGFDYPLAEALKMEPKLRQYAETEGKELIELALKLEGLSRHTSTHAAGVVISDRPIVEHLPLMVDKENQVVTQFSMSWVEKIGLLKFDFLGLKTLTVLKKATQLIAEDMGKVIDLNMLPLDDPRPYNLISEGKTIGVFQLESSGITEMVERLRPNCFDDLVAILALYRPGPLDAGMVDHYINRKHKREKIEYQHPLLESILSDTYGIILYQEQIMQIARDMAGYTLGGADMLRRAMGKKKPEEMAKQREIFVSGSKAQGIAEAVASEVFDQMETFARYGFNRSHSAAYAMISYQTAYLKAYYCEHFMAALMSFEMDDTDKTLKNINECRQLGINVHMPDVNLGQVGFSVRDVSKKSSSNQQENGQEVAKKSSRKRKNSNQESAIVTNNKEIIFGLAAIKGLGEKVVEKIIEERKSKPYQDFYDFCKRNFSSGLNKRSYENLIRAGAFDWAGKTRNALFEAIDFVTTKVASEEEHRNSAQQSLFDLFDSEETQGDASFKYSEVEWPINIKLSHEREALGLYLSGHPLEKFRHDLERLGTLTIEKLKEKKDGDQVTIAGVITLLKLKNTKKGDRYASFVLEDLLSTIEVLVWPDTYLKCFELLESPEPIIIKGKLDIGEERMSLVANELFSAIALRDKSTNQMHLQFNPHTCDEKKLKQLKILLTKFHGNCPVKFVIRGDLNTQTLIALPAEFAVVPSEELSNEIEKIFGQDIVRYV